MTTRDADTLSGEDVTYPNIGTVSRELLAASVNQDRKTQELNEAWLFVFDALVAWGTHPERFEDDGVDPPSPAAISNAAKVATKLRELEADPPTRIVPNGDGGIVFESQRAHEFETIEIDSAGEIEARVFENSRLIERRRLN